MQAAPAQWCVAHSGAGWGGPKSTQVLKEAGGWAWPAAAGQVRAADVQGGPREEQVDDAGLRTWLPQGNLNGFRNYL